MATRNHVQSKRSAMVDLIRQYPGITSPEIAEKLGIDNPTRVTNGLYGKIKAGRIVAERSEIDGRWMNQYYMVDQVPPDAAERINQKLVAASEVIPMAKSADARNSVFDLGSLEKKKNGNTVFSAPFSARAATQSADFACAVTNDGTLVLIRQGEIQFSLTEREAETLQSYLVKRAAANFIASMT